MKYLLLPLIIILMLTSSIYGASYQKTSDFDCGFSRDFKSGLSFSQDKWHSERDDSYSNNLTIDFGNVQPNSVYCFTKAISICNTGPSQLRLTLRDDDTGSNFNGRGLSVQVTVDNYNCTRQYCWAPQGQRNQQRCNSPEGITLECSKKLSQNYAYVTFTVTTPYNWHPGDRSAVTLQFLLTQVH